MKRRIVICLIIILYGICLISNHVGAAGILFPGGFDSAIGEIEESEVAWRQDDWDEAMDELQMAEEIITDLYPLLQEGPAKHIIREFMFALAKYKEAVSLKASKTQCADAKELFVSTFFRIKDAYWHIYPAAMNYIFIELLEIEEAVEREDYKNAILSLTEMRFAYDNIKHLLVEKNVSKEKINDFILLLNQLETAISLKGKLRKNIDRILDHMKSWQSCFIPAGAIVTPARLLFLIESLEEIEDQLTSNRYFRAREELVEMKEDLEGIRPVLEKQGLRSDYILLKFSVDALEIGIKERKSLEIMSFPLLYLEVLINMLQDKFYHVLPHAWYYLMDEVIKLREAINESEWDNAYYSCFELGVIFPILESQLAELGVSPEERRGFIHYINDIKNGLGDDNKHASVADDVKLTIELLDRWGAAFLNKADK